MPCDAATRGRFGGVADVDVDDAAPLAACAASATTTPVAAVADAADEAATRDDAPSSPVPRDAATRGRFGGVADVDVDDAAPLAACAASATTTSVANLDLRVGRDDDAADRDVSVVAGAAAHSWLPLPLAEGGVAGVVGGASPSARIVGRRSSAGCVMSVKSVSVSEWVSVALTERANGVPTTRTRL